LILVHSSGSSPLSLPSAAASATSSANSRTYVNGHDALSISSLYSFSFF
jgi:hypothetical protein